MTRTTTPTLTGDPFRVMIQSDAWGTREVLRACQQLPRDQFHRCFPIGLGTLHDTLTHVIGAMRSWTDRLAERPVRPRLMALSGRPATPTDARERSPAELTALVNEAEVDLLSTTERIVRESRLGTTVVLDWPTPLQTAQAGAPGAADGSNNRMTRYTFTRAAVIVHVVTHGYHHRAQCLNMLRQLGAPVPGVTPGLPEVSAVDWQMVTESPGVEVSSA